MLRELLDIVNKREQLPLAIDLGLSTRCEAAQTLFAVNVSEHWLHDPETSALLSPALAAVGRLSHTRAMCDVWSSPDNSDTELSYLVKLHRHFVADSRMFSLSIVIRFDAFEYFWFSHASGRKSLPVNQFDFQRVKETLHRSIVVTVCFAAHAATQTMVADQSLIALRTIQAAAVWMYDRPLWKVAADPVAAIKFLMEQNDLTRKDLEPYIGPSGRVSEVLTKKRNLTLPMIKRLHEGLRIPYESLIQ